MTTGPGDAPTTHQKSTVGAGAPGKFPAAKTERSDSSIEVPAGRFETWLFTVRDQAKDGTPMVKRYHFAKSMPGPPVLFTIESAGGEVFRMTLLERSAP